MPERTVKPHWLRDNQIERSPRRIVVFDTETRWSSTGAGETHALRLWVARTLYRAGTPMRTSRHVLDSGSTAEQLADAIDRIADDTCTTWVFAHNLGFDLTVTKLPLLLLARGWKLGHHALTLDSPWLQMSNGKRRLTMADSVSWLPKSVEALGRLMGIEKVPLPDNDDDDATWLARCSIDVDIVACALEQLLDWWDRGKRGCWSLTGAATGWNAYRHIKHASRVLIEADPDARAFERRAINAGRREVWRVGHLPKARYVELDFERAHLTVCRRKLLPVKRSNAFGPIGLDDWRLHAHSHAPIAEVTVRTTVPRYPVELEGRIWYPVGTFRTILCGPEIHDAMNRGELLAVHRGIMYRLGASMDRWATWINDTLDGIVPDTPPMAELACKAWSRRVPGKWATRTSKLLMELPAPEQSWHLERGIDHPSGQRCALLYIGGRVQHLLQDQDADDAFPAVLAFIQSHTRVAMGKLIDHFGPEWLVSCNTDGLIVRCRRGPDLEALNALTAPLEVRVKAVYHDVKVLSPQHLVLDGDPRLSGVPHAAASSSALHYAWATWPSFTRQLEMTSSAGYTREARAVDLTHVPVNRWVLRDGTTVPPRAAETGLGGSRLLPWDQTPPGKPGTALRAGQHPALERAGLHSRSAVA
jgi:hypothetical protein